MEDQHWGDSGMRCFGMLVDGRAQKSGICKLGEEVTLLMIINDHSDVVKFMLPECAGGVSWSLLIDTNYENLSESGMFAFGADYDVTSRSVILLALDSGTVPTL
jgi:isoamylase